MKEIQTAERKTPGLEALELLQSLTAAQRQESRPVLPPVLPAKRKDIFKEFRAGRVFEEIYQEAARLHLELRTDDELKELRNCLAGAIFQEMAYCFLVNTIQPKIVLSAERTLEFYSRLHPQESRINYPFGQDSLRGISVPDGLAIDEGGSISDVCEYTTYGNWANFKNKYRHFCESQGEFTELFANVRLLFVLPEGHYRFFGNNGPGKNVEVYRLSFNHEQFRDFIDGIYRTNHGEATFLDLQNRVRGQIERGTRY